MSGLKRFFFSFPVCLFLFSCKQQADLLVYNARIYTVDEKFTVAEAMAVKNGKIEAVGTSKEIQDRFEAKETINANGLFVYPGLIDAHAHFYRYGLNLQTADLVGTQRWEEILQRLKNFAADHKDGWLVGRGWDQNDWPVKEYPDNKMLDSLFPGRPVLLTRVDGHAAIANTPALHMAGITTGMKITGGSVEESGGRPTGVLIDNAVDLVSSKIPPATSSQVVAALQAAQQACFAVGLTTVDDCGIDYREALTMDSLQKAGILKMRVYAMLSDARQNYEFLFRHGKMKTDFLNIRSFKVYADGALGSRGACLLQPYSDRPGWTGFLLSSRRHFDSVASILNEKDFQMCTHAIGDSGNRVILDIYGRHLKGKNDRRWRIEHAQVVHPDDFRMFGAYSVIPSVQPTHATSDMYWAGDRLGKEREKGAYAYKQLMQQNGWIPLGTDFPVEDISPFKTFYASVWRQDAKGYPDTGYQMENALTREQALRGMTIWAARSNFEEGEKGSLEKGKLADFILCDTDLLQAAPESILQSTVLGTWVGGRKVYGR